MIKVNELLKTTKPDTLLCFFNADDEDNCILADTVSEVSAKTQLYGDKIDIHNLLKSDVLSIEPYGNGLKIILGESLIEDLTIEELTALQDLCFKERENIEQELEESLDGDKFPGRKQSKTEYYTNMAYKLDKLIEDKIDI